MLIFLKFNYKILTLTNMNEKNQQKDKELRTPLLVPKSSNVLPPKSNYSDSSQQNNNAIDMMRLVSKIQKSRVSKINFTPFQLEMKKDENKIRRSQNPPRQFSQIDYKEDDKYSTVGARGDAVQKLSKNLQNQSFLTNYQNNNIIGILLYIIFVVFIVVEVVAATILLPKSNDQSPFFIEETLLTILASQLIYYLLIRYISSVTDKRFYMQSSAKFSFRKLMQKAKLNHAHHTDSKYSFVNWIFERPYIILFTIIASVIIGQITFAILASQSVPLLSRSSSEQYMISTLFWAYFGVPFLVSNFYLNRPVQDLNLKMKIFPFILFGFMFESIIESSLFFFLMFFKFIHTYIQQKQQFDVFHVDQLIKAVFLLAVIIFTVIKYIFIDQQAITKQLTNFCLTIFWHVILITLAMLLTRIIAIKYVKQQLYKHFYTEMHINLAIVLASVLLNISYIFVRSQFITLVFLNVIFLGLIGSIIYLEGREKMLVTMDDVQNQQYF